MSREEVHESMGWSPGLIQAEKIQVVDLKKEESYKQKKINLALYIITE